MKTASTTGTVAHGRWFRTTPNVIVLHVDESQDSEDELQELDNAGILLPQGIDSP